MARVSGEIVLSPSKNTFRPQQKVIKNKIPKIEFEKNSFAWESTAIKLIHDVTPSDAKIRLTTAV